MSRTFAYVRVSTLGQTVDNQVLEIAAAGFAVEPHRVVSETVSGSEAIARRASFSRLLDRMEPGDVLAVTRLDRLGRAQWTSAPRWRGSPAWACGCTVWPWAASI